MRLIKGRMCDYFTGWNKSLVTVDNQNKNKMSENLSFLSYHPRDDICPPANVACDKPKHWKVSSRVSLSALALSFVCEITLKVITKLKLLTDIWLMCCDENEPSTKNVWIDEHKTRHYNDKMSRGSFVTSDLLITFKWRAELCDWFKGFIASNFIAKY